jgi:acyl-coenzyme A synthetase/AMP-(fatty) acid ligase
MPEAAVIQTARDQGTGGLRLCLAQGGDSKFACPGRRAEGLVAKKSGPIARPDEILFAAELPKTRSGKNMCRLLQDIADGRALGDTTTLADPTVAKLKEPYEEE